MTAKSSVENNLVASGRVVAWEHLAEISERQNFKTEAKELRKKAKHTRERFPQWTGFRNADPDLFYMIFGFLPFAVDIIHTRADMPL